MLKKGIDNLLFLSHEFLAFFEAAGFTLNVDNGTVVKGAVENSGGDGDVRKDLVLLGEWCDTFLTEKVRRKTERMVKKYLQN